MTSPIILPRSAVHCRVALSKGRGRILLSRLGIHRNLVVAGGLDGLASSPFSSLVTHCHCGTGSEPVDISDEGLDNYFAGTSNVVDSNGLAKGLPPYFGEYTQTFRFAAGTFSNQIITEVGFANQVGDGGLFSRALIELPDQFSDPTAMLMRSDEWLDVAYSFRLYPAFVNADGSLADGSGTLQVGSDSHAYTIRPANVTNLLYWKAQSAQAAFVAVSGSYASSYGPASVLGEVSNAPSSPSGADAQGPDSAVSVGSYTPGGYARNINLAIAPGDCNATGGVGALRFNTGMGSYQIAFDPVVPKSSLGTWNFTATLSWQNAET